MGSNLKVAFFQADCAWEDTATNISVAAAAVRSSAADMVILPEMFATGFSMSPQKIAQPMSGQIVTAMRDLAVSSGKALIFSAAISQNGNYFNRLFFIDPTGEIKTYDKRHLFRMAGEDKAYQGGNERLVVEYKGVKICPLVCYDLRFPVFSRNDVNYDLLVYVASWPSVRAYPWKQLLIARAIENQAYCIGVNRVGADPKNEYSGGSVCIDFTGQIIAGAEPYKEQMVEIEISASKRAEFTKNFPAYMDADKFKIL